jgi:hypothetical protein
MAVGMGTSSKKLPAWAIVLLLLAGSALIGALALVGLGAFLWSKKDVLVATGKEAFAEADTFAAHHSQKECVDQAFADFAHCPGFKCELRTSLFVERCMKNAEASPAFCAEVPKPSNIFGVSTWAIQSCNQRGFYGANQSCVRIMQHVSSGCHAPGTAPRER